MIRPPSPPAVPWHEVARQAAVEHAARVLLDPTSHPAHVAGARGFLARTRPLTDLARDVVNAGGIDAVRAIRDLLRDAETSAAELLLRSGG